MAMQVSMHSFQAPRPHLVPPSVPPYIAPPMGPPPNIGPPTTPTAIMPQTVPSTITIAIKPTTGASSFPLPSVGGGQPTLVGGHFDGRRMRSKTTLRRTVDYNASMINYLQNRIWQRDSCDMRVIQPDSLYNQGLVPPAMLLDTPVNALTTRSVRTATNKIKCPIFCTCWTPEGRRLVTGASSGEFTLWNGLTFSFETILQAHDMAVRAMVWSHNDLWMLTADHSGFVKYWQSNMNNVKMYQAHKDPVRGLRWASSAVLIAHAVRYDFISPSDQQQGGRYCVVMHLVVGYHSTVCLDEDQDGNAINVVFIIIFIIFRWCTN